MIHKMKWTLLVQYGKKQNINFNQGIWSIKYRRTIERIHQEIVYATHIKLRVTNAELFSFIYFSVSDYIWWLLVYGCLFFSFVFRYGQWKRNIYYGILMSKLLINLTKRKTERGFYHICFRFSDESSQTV